MAATVESAGCYTLHNTNGAEVTVAAYGARVTALRVRDKSGNFRNVVLGFPALRQYEEALGYFGATIGRYANRICGARFELDGKEYQLPENDGGNTLHGGHKGFDTRTWELDQADTTSCAFTLSSDDMDEGFPGKLEVSVEYKLTDENALEIEFRATTTQTTPINLTHHSYFNLNGEPGSILNHALRIDADRIVVVDDKLRPTGELKHVAGTPFDFREEAIINSKISLLANGYDHNFCLNAPSMSRPSVTLYSPATGITLDMFTNQPGVQVYTSNGMTREDTCGAFDRFYGLTLETQTYPDGINHSNFPSAVLRPGQTYHHVVRYQFGIRG